MMVDYSFIIPVYNCKEYLESCVDSIRAVQVERYEIILVDDGAKDGSDELCDSLAARYSEIRVIHQANGGVSAARNRGIQEALGERLLFLDADDSIDPALMERILRSSRCNEVDLVVFGMSFDYYYHGKCYRRDTLCYEHDGILSREEWGGEFVSLYCHNLLSPVWNKVFKRDILMEHQLELDTQMFLYEDFEFVLRYLRYCESIWNVPQAVYHYRQTEDEGNAKRRLARIDNLPVLLEHMKSAMEQLSWVQPGERKKVLSQLYQVLARGKISVSDLTGVRDICNEFKAWVSQHEIPLQGTKFERLLLEGKALPLWLEDKKTALRHKVAVWVKAHLKNYSG